MEYAALVNIIFLINMVDDNLIGRMYSLSVFMYCMHTSRMIRVNVSSVSQSQIDVFEVDRVFVHHLFAFVRTYFF